MIKDDILSTLSASDGFVSGEKLSQLCGVSRAAIWKQIKNLQQEGYPITSHRGLGYQLILNNDVYNEREILHGLLPMEIISKDHLVYFDEVDSTNKVAKQMALDGCPEGTVVIADNQSQGRGRLGRAWTSGKGVGIWCSLVLKPKIAIQDASHFSFIIAVAVADGIQQATGTEVKIKWPNDILVNNKKVCGILIELVSELQQIESLIVGFGVNVNQQVGHFDEALQEKATSLAIEANHLFGRGEIVAKILAAIDYWYGVYLKKGFLPIKKYWLSLTSIINEQVVILANGQIVAQGKAIGIDDQGALLLENDRGVETIVSGEVSLRKVDQSYW